MSETVPFSKLFDEWKTDAAFVLEYERIGPDMDLAFALSDARREAGLTQVEVARRMGISQAAVARMEGGKGQADVGDRGALRQCPWTAGGGGAGRCGVSMSKFGKELIESAGEAQTMAGGGSNPARLTPIDAASNIDSDETGAEGRFY